jgi:hypothetical protein
MDIGGEGVGVYAEAKGEYTRQLCQYIVPAMQSFFLTMLEEAKTLDPDSKKGLMNFQKLLEGITDWNHDKVQRETAAVITATHCDYMEELLTAVFIAHTKILSAIRLTTKQKKLQITIPKLDHFIHRTMTECARLLWTNTYLFSASGTSMERQKNMRQIEGLINDGVNQAIRSMLPVKSILKEYLRDDEDEHEEEVEAKVEAKPEVPEVKVEVPEEKPEEPKEKVEEPKEKVEEKPEEKVEEKVEEKIEEKVEEKSEEKPEPKVEEKVEEVDAKPEAKPETKSEAKPLDSARSNTPTIIVGSEGDARVKFTGLDSVFDSENPEGSDFKPMTEESEQDAVDFSDIPGEALNDFDLIGDESLPMDGFEEL